MGKFRNGELASGAAANLGGFRVILSQSTGVSLSITKVAVEIGAARDRTLGDPRYSEGVAMDRTQELCDHRHLSAPWAQQVARRDRGNHCSASAQRILLTSGQNDRISQGQSVMESKTSKVCAHGDAAGRQLDVHVRALLTTRDVPAEGCGATALDSRHDLQLVEAHVTGIGLAPRRSVVTEDIRDLQRWT
jgi:hypothetical protein